MLIEFVRRWLEWTSFMEHPLLLQQCDQIGQFLKILGDKYSYKSKTAMASFWTTFGRNLGFFLFQHLVTFMIASLWLCQTLVISLSANFPTQNEITMRLMRLTLREAKSMTIRRRKSEIFCWIIKLLFCLGKKKSEEAKKLVY